MNTITSTQLAGEEKIASADGTGIFIRWWLPTGTRRGVVAIVPGFNSHSGHYAWAAGQLAESGLAVYAVDLRGRGRSEGERFYVESFDDYLGDVHALIQHARSGSSGLPIVLLGHSAGGVVAAAYASEHQAELAGLICESFAFRVPAPAIVLSITKWLSRIFPHLRVLKLPNKEFSRDAQVVRALNEDPLIRNEAQPSKTVAQMLEGNARLERSFGKFKMPVLIIHGTGDKVTVPAGSRIFYEKAASADKTLNMYPDHAHDLLSDIGKAQVMQDIKRWIAKHI